MTIRLTLDLPAEVDELHAYAEACRDLGLTKIHGEQHHLFATIHAGNLHVAPATPKPAEPAPAKAAVRRPERVGGARAAAKKRGGNQPNTVATDAASLAGRMLRHLATLPNGVHAGSASKLAQAVGQTSGNANKLAGNAISKLASAGYVVVDKKNQTTTRFITITDAGRAVTNPATKSDANVTTLPTRQADPPARTGHPAIPRKPIAPPPGGLKAPAGGWA